MNDILMFGGEHTNAYMSRIAEDPFYAKDEWHRVSTKLLWRKYL